MSCRTFREQASQRVVDLDLRADGRVRVIDPSQSLEQWCSSVADSSVPEHGRACPQCASHWSRLLIQVRLLSTMVRVPAPADLEGRVVAALQPGHRQQRAISAVESLPSLEAPPVLARRLEAAMSAKAPSVLLERVEQEYELSVSGASSERDERVLWSPMTALVSASLLLLALWAVGPDRGLDAPGSEPESDQKLARGDAAAGKYRFEIIRVESPRQASLDPATRYWIDGLSGGMLGSVD